MLYIYLTVYTRICERASDKIFYATFLANYFTFSMAHGWCMEITSSRARAGWLAGTSVKNMSTNVAGRARTYA